MPEPGWPWGEAGPPVDSIPPDPAPSPATACGHDQVPQVDRRVQVPVMPGPAVGAGPPGFPLQVPVDGPAGAAGLAAGKPHGGEDHLGVAPLALVDQLPLDVAHPGVGLRLRDTAPHHSRHVQVLDDQLAVLPW